MKITSAKCVLKTEDSCVVQWTGLKEGQTDNDGYGEISITHIPETGDYKISAEYMTIDFVLRVLHMTDFDKVEKSWR